MPFSLYNLNFPDENRFNVSCSLASFLSRYLFSNASAHLHSICTISMAITRSPPKWNSLSGRTRYRAVLVIEPYSLSSRTRYRAVLVIEPYSLSGRHICVLIYLYNDNETPVYIHRIEHRFLTGAEGTTRVISLELHAVNADWKRVSQRSLLQRIWYHFTN